MSSTGQRLQSRSPGVDVEAQRQRLSHGVGFWAVAFAFATVLGFSAVPTPLYGLYAGRDGFGTLTITFVFATYAVGVIAALFLVGHLSDHHGRRRLLLPAVLANLVSVVLFLVWRDLPGLLLARFVSGLGVGAVTATATAWLAELHSIDRPGATSRRAEVVGIAANLGGIGVGPLISGALAEWVGHPLTVPFVVFGVALALSAVAVAFVPETRSVARRDRPRYRPQRISVPEQGRAPFLGALGDAFIAFAAFGFFTSLAPRFLAGALDHPSHALAGFAAFAVFAAAVVSQVVLAERDDRELLLAGAGAVVVGAVAVVVALWLSSPSLALFLVGGAVLGAGSGALFKACLSTVVRVADPARRAETLVGLFLAGYVGLVIPAVGLGLLTRQVADKTALLCFGVVLVLGVAASLQPLLRSASR